MLAPTKITAHPLPHCPTRALSIAAVLASLAITACGGPGSGSISEFLSGVDSCDDDCVIIDVTSRDSGERFQMTHWAEGALAARLDISSGQLSGSLGEGDERVYLEIDADVSVAEWRTINGGKVRYLGNTFCVAPRSISRWDLRFPEHLGILARLRIFAMGEECDEISDGVVLIKRWRIAPSS